MRDLLEFATREGHVLFQRKRDAQVVRLPVVWDTETILDAASA
jgi:hypothetical protein